jgi:hypothetical protein
MLDAMLADPTHRCKCGWDKCYSLTYLKGTVLKIDQYDCEKIVHLMGYYFHSHRNLPFERFMQKSTCIVDHHFDNHTNCSAHWCKAVKIK